mmetsp:Transcript_4049/g.5289  ORF Transcript_4049/g.5289 Transcript_4049/m.5289 type:complete len:211 (+) Transcript_4049:1573-2205(+)
MKTTSRPSGYSGVFMLTSHDTIPSLLVPIGRDPGTSFPLSSSISSWDEKIPDGMVTDPSSSLVTYSSHCPMRPTSRSPRKSYAYVEPTRRAMARLVWMMLAPTYGSRKHTWSFESPRTQNSFVTPVIGSSLSKNAVVFSHSPSIDVATRRTGLTTGFPSSSVDKSLTLTSISSTLSFNRRLASLLFKVAMIFSNSFAISSAVVSSISGME